MKIKEMFISFSILLFAVQVFFAQETPKAELIDEFGKLCSEEVMANYDNYMFHLQNNPSATGYFVFYGNDSMEGTNLTFIKYLTEIYPTLRRYDKSRIVLIRGENRGEMKTQFWIVPAGAIPPIPEKKFVQEKITSTTRFDKNWADFHKWFAKLEIYDNGFFDLGCEFSPNVNEFARILLTEKDLTGYLVIYGNNKKRAEKVAKFAVNDLVKTNKIPRNRLKTIYGGKSEEPQIEFWFVPKGNKPPEINSKQIQF